MARKHECKADDLAVELGDGNVMASAVMAAKEVNQPFDDSYKQRDTERAAISRRVLHTAIQYGFSSLKQVDEHKTEYLNNLISAIKTASKESPPPDNGHPEYENRTRRVQKLQQQKEAKNKHQK